MSLEKEYKLEVSSYKNMMSRCYNSKTPLYNRYGGRGIIVCDRWKGNIKNFIEDMGRRPSKEYSLERNEVDGNYEQSNCRWATKKEQNNNTSRNNIIELNGEKLTAQQWSDKLGIKANTIIYRLRRGWEIKKALKIA